MSNARLMRKRLRPLFLIANSAVSKVSSQRPSLMVWVGLCCACFMESKDKLRLPLCLGYDSEARPMKLKVDALATIPEEREDLANCALADVHTAVIDPILARYAGKVRNSS